MTHTNRLPVWQLLVLAVGVVLLAGCGDKPDAAACETAMQKQLAAGVAAGNKATPGTKPAECNGLSDADLQKIGEKVLGEQLGGTTTPSP